MNITPAITVDRLERLYFDVLMEDSIEFDMRYWGKARETVDLGKVIDKSTADKTCGFAACALGTAALDPYFNRLGLRLKSVFKSPDMTTFDVCFRDEEEFEGDYESAAKIFGITPDEASSLFDPDDYLMASGDPDRKIPKSRVLKRIENMIIKYYTKQLESQ